MDADDLPRRKGDLAGQLAAEPLDSLSVDELSARIALLEAEIARTARHRETAGRTRAAAEALFGTSRPALAPSGPPPSGPPPSGETGR
ncbi:MULTISPECIES: DUF1192 family protein [unclassified Novosphingobium]|uniref:DUF1192 family protein n=1 Tax=Novosphingobium TaxID=165696 RepID=UPI0014472FCB|nr:uncharacterized small protein (DUF1192 family) [Novosphingobium sp. SG720]NMN05722.1 uncharacterized small protein (DUF1192 family) [Novosphingobium sp. SG919]NMN87918.1 uncharacterized small protein (DUF1192 family) [Novosphingobium sp. SG916]